MEHIKNFIIGSILGVANVIPGVSAGTMAVVFNVYDKILDAISLKKEKIRKYLPFLLTIGLGGVVGIVLFSSMIKYLYTYYEQEASFFFIGIILGSIPMIVKKAFPQKKLAIGQMVAFLITLLLLVAISFIQNNEAQHEILTQLNITQGINIFLSGIVAAVTMIIPGISGSFMLLVMGSYETVVSAVSDTNITILAFFGVGCIIGLLVGAKLVKILLRDYKDITYASILGLVVGSVFSLYPGLGGGGLKTLFLIVLLAIGMGISVLFSKQ